MMISFKLPPLKIKHIVNVFSPDWTNWERRIFVNLLLKRRHDEIIYFGFVRLTFLPMTDVSMQK